MRKIIIKIPKDKNDKWLLGLGNRPRSMMRCDTLINRLDRVLPSWLNVNGKTAIVIKSMNSSHWEKNNESLNSKDKDYLLYCATCFLEDFLSAQTLNRVWKKTNFKSAPDDI